MTLQTTDVPRQNPETAARVIDDSMFVLHAETSELHALNDVGARIWELVDGEHDVAAITAAIEAEYEVDPAEAAADVVAFLDQLTEKGLIVL
jgi:PqqD family protein of HPr-rel-A system